MTLFFAIAVLEIPSQIQIMLPNKYIGELSDSELNISSSRRKNSLKSDTASTEKVMDTAKKITEAFFRFQKQQNSKNSTGIAKLYVYKELKESDLTYIHLLLSNPIIFTFTNTDEDNAQILAIHEISLSYNVVMRVIKHIKSIEKHAVKQLLDAIPMYREEISEELLLQKNTIEQKYELSSFSKELDRFIKDPNLLIRSKRLLNIYSKWLEQLTKLRFE